ncbi:MAG TPA: ABC transporter permease, partial [Bacillota bacterium]|nr:ABC transporter permease [Bacillota bacterium]
MSKHSPTWWKNSNFLVGGSIVCLLLLLMLTSFFWTPYSPTAPSAAAKLQAPSFIHLLGTDHLGRDVFSRIMVASQTAFLVGISSVGAGCLLGVSLGLTCGYYGGWFDLVT